ncbi:MAG: ion channel [Saprospiraceae bacterium]|nr:ion channel [Saprospiraceae bacterium]
MLSKFAKKVLQNNDFGFGKKISKNKNHLRMVNKDGSFNIIRKGGGKWQLGFYQKLVTMSWVRFSTMLILFYIIMNSCFALMYMLVGVDSLTGAVEDKSMNSFWDAFYFSVQTLTTVGYGSLSPKGFGANLVAAIGAFAGLLSFAVATGLLFARFARPRADILFSEKALIAPYLNGLKSFQIRVVNKRRNILTDMQASLMITWVENEQQQYRLLNLERNSLHFFPLNWTIVHPIDTTSPLYGWSKEKMTECKVEFLIVLQGYDDTFSNKVRTHSSYCWHEIEWEKRFEPMYYINEDGYTILELEKLSQTRSSQ